ncbi:MAG: nuclear transport factor 2 family protein [Dokdonella sp.]
MRRGLPILLSLFAAACAHTPDADAIRHAIQSIADAAQAQQRASVLAHVADDFIGNDGELDRAGLEQLLRARLLAGRSIGVTIGTVEVELDGDRATARFEATVTDGSGRWLPDRRAVLQFVTGWRRQDREWRCYNAKWSETR